MSAHINISLLDTSNIGKQESISSSRYLQESHGGPAREGCRYSHAELRGAWGAFLLRYLLIVSDTNDCHL